MSIYILALTLSSALMTTSKPSQNVSWNTFSVSGQARFWRASIQRLGLIALAAAAATVDFACLIFQSRNRNWRLKLLFSMTSSSVIVSFPLGLQDTPIKARFFKNSHPRAPDPTTKVFASSSFF
ncbi:Os07g0692950 [Oryza sativa Japonica Group]|uniref:Os07g0692950 protein n=1 Tax=Oryza sativa subsp. japonica TaxID=39947 RepID=A0A0P0XAR7_ORYSJ|nr:hypothetical protein EE612_041545 [Oryza sativa]BAT03351.1 Os07g0692950 [Oryza sativa Japonica Group]